MGNCVDPVAVTLDVGPIHRPNQILNGRLRADSVLKTGGNVDTFAGVDLRTGDMVVIKRIDESTTPARVRARLVHEADVLRQMATHGESGGVETIREAGFLYLIRPYVEGQTLARRLEDGPLPVRSVLNVAIGLLETLGTAHDLQVLHRDIKPANVIVSGAGFVDFAALIDFGLARSPSLEGSLRDERVGTARYLAPEAAGLVERTVDERSDLYSFGVLVFECVAGRPPFEGADVGEVLRQHLNAAPPLLSSDRPDIPRALDALVQRLLRKNPEERYQSAAAVLVDLRALRAGIDRGEADPAVVIGLYDHRRVLTEPAFVGRAAELDVLDELVAAAARGAGGLTLVEAESGGGKSRLLDELAQRIQGSAWVLRGQGVDQSARRPFQLLDGVVRGIMSAAVEDPAFAQELRHHVGDRVEAVVAALPDLAATLSSDGRGNLGPEAYGETRSIAALTSLLDGLSAADRQTVVLLDDCQWADDATLRLLMQWQNETPSEPRNVLVIAAFRSEEAPADFPLRLARPLASIALPAFASQDVQSLAESMAGSLPDEVLHVLEILSEGSPFMVGAVLRGLVETGALIDSPSGWRVDEAELATAQTSRQAALFLVRRLELLAHSTLELLSAGAILGKEFELEIAMQLCGQDAEDVEAGLKEAAHRRIVWPDDQSGRVRLLHDKLREALLSRLDGNSRHALHLRAALKIQAIDDERDFELAYHFDAAGRDDLALPYALRAAETARAQYSLDVAIAHYRIAQRALTSSTLARDASQHSEASVAESLGDVLTLKGSYEEATTQLEAALAHSDSDLGRAGLRGKLGDVAFKRGDHRRARAELEGAVRDLGGKLPRSAVGLVLALIAEVLVQTAHTLAPSVFLGRRSAVGADRAFLEIRLYSRLAYVYWFSAGKIFCAWAHLREMNLAERYPSSAELAQAYSEHAPVMTIAPWFKRGIVYAKRSFAIREDLGDIWGQGQSLNFHGVALYAASRYHEAIETLREAVRLLDQTGDRWEANTATWNIALALYRLGDLDDAIAVSRKLYAAALAIGDETAAGTSLSVWSRASAGNVPAELIAAQIANGNGDAQTNADLHVADGVRLLGSNETSAAVDVFVEANRIVKEAGLRQEYVAPASPWLATALRCEAEATSLYDSAKRHDLARRARRAARRGWRIARFYRNNGPHALRELALLAAMEGRRSRAQRLFRRSLAMAEAQEARYEQVLTRLAAAEAGMALGNVSADAEMVSARAELASLLPQAPDELVADATPAPSLSLADRFASLLDAGREIAAAASAPAVHSAVVRAATKLLRGDSCRLLPMTGELVPSGLADAALPHGVSRGMLQLALTEGCPILLTDCYGESVDSADSIVLLGLRSALCTVISSQGAPVAWLYVTHASVSDLYGTAEIQMADFISTLAGAALDHVANTEARFRSLAQNSSDVITIIDTSGKIAYQSAALTRVFGLEPSALIGSSFEQWLHPADSERIRSILEGVAIGKQDTTTFECRLRHNDGSWRYVETALNDLTHDPSVDGFVLNTRDITDRNAAEAELRRTLDELTTASSLLNATLDATIDGILVVDFAGSIRSFNRRVVEMLGVPEHILATRDEQAVLMYVVDQLIEPHGFFDKITELYANSEAESYDLVEFKDGRVFERGSKPQRIGSDVAGRVWCFRDVTERVQTEKALSIARDEAMEASRLKSEFVATTSHEIRSPMNGVIGLTALLLDTKLDEEQREFAEGVHSSAAALLVVINDILDFSKIEAGKLELEDVDFDLAATVEEITGLVNPSAIAKNLELETQYERSVPLTLRGDVGRLRQILLNLLTNAVKFTEQGTVTIRIGVKARRDDGRVPLHIAVEDTGVGLAMSDSERLFEPFSQADASTTRRYGGTGLGLTICQRLAKAMGGAIGVRSELGVGSVFWTEIPFAIRDAALTAIRPTDMPVEIRTSATPYPMRGCLLIVEDNAINQLVARKIVQHLGYSCEIASNGIEALVALGHRHFDAVLMDCYMPDMDGFDATRELRQRESDSGQHTPVIAMTAGAMADDRKRCVMAGMDDYVAKPVSRASLEAVLDRWTAEASAS